MENSNEVKQKGIGIPGKQFASLMFLWLAGQLAWAIENQYYNTYLYDRITPNPQAVSWMVSITAVAICSPCGTAALVRAGWCLRRCEV